MSVGRWDVVDAYRPRAGANPPTARRRPAGANPMAPGVPQERIRRHRGVRLQTRIRWHLASRRREFDGTAASACRSESGSTGRPAGANPTAPRRPPAGANPTAPGVPQERIRRHRGVRLQERMNSPLQRHKVRLRGLGGRGACGVPGTCASATRSNRKLSLRFERHRPASAGSLPRPLRARSSRRGENSIALRILRLTSTSPSSFGGGGRVVRARRGRSPFAPSSPGHTCLPVSFSRFRYACSSASLASLRSSRAPRQWSR